jgi:Arc/MetJ-type ribon-helix-helix transcriptional regulator
VIPYEEMSERAISVRLDEEAAAALRSLTRSGVSTSEAIRQSLIETAARRRIDRSLAAEAARLAADREDRREAAEVAAVMEALRAPR